MCVTNNGSIDSQCRKMRELMSDALLVCPPDECGRRYEQSLITRKRSLAVFGEKSKGNYIDSNEFKAFKRGLFSFDWNQDYDVLYFKEGTNNRYDIMKDINKGVEIYRRVTE